MQWLNKIKGKKGIYSNWDLRLTRCQPSKGNGNLLLNTKKPSLYVDEPWWRPWYEILPHKGTYVFKSSLWHPEEILKPFCLITRYSISCRFASIISIKIIFLSFICIYFSSCLMNCGNLPCIHLDIVNLSGSLQCLLWSKLWVYWFWRAWKCERCNFKDDTLLIWHYQNT